METKKEKVVPKWCRSFKSYDFFNQRGQLKTDGGSFFFDTQISHISFFVKLRNKRIQGISKLQNQKKEHKTFWFEE